MTSRLERLLLHHVGPFSDVELRFDPCPEPGKAEIHMFVGPNGSGKSTILMAMVQMFGHEVELIAPRFASKDAYVAIESDDHATVVVRRDPTVLPAMPPQLAQVLGGHPSWTRSDGPLHYVDRVGNRSEAFGEYRIRASGRLKEPMPQFIQPALDSPLEFAAFGYSGYRPLGSYSIEAIQELTGDPLEGALSFVNTADSRKLVQWIANTKAKAALAASRGDTELADRRAAIIERVESVIGRIIDRDIRFVLEEEPLAVKMLQSGAAVELDVLADGLKSILSWIADILMRMDRVKWHDDTPVLDRPFVLFLDEIEIHLHPAWQRRVLPAVQELFSSAQIFVATHSPFVVGSVNDAWIHPLVLEDDGARALDPLPSRAGHSYATILSEVFGVSEEFGVETEEDLATFYELRDRRLAGEAGVQAELDRVADELRQQGVETRDIVEREMRQLARRLEKTA